MTLTMDYFSPVTEKNVTGIGVPEKGGEEPQCIQHRGFFASGFSLYGRAGRGAERLAGCLSRYANPFGSAHPDWRRGVRFSNLNERRIMTDTSPSEIALSLGRHPASILNPFIGVHAEETMDHCTRAVADLGYIISSLEGSGCDFNMDNLFRFFETITFALRYEIAGMRRAGQERRDD